MYKKVISIKNIIQTPKLSSVMQEKISLLLNKYDIKVDIKNNSAHYLIYEKDSQIKKGSASLRLRTLDKPVIEISQFYPQLNPQNKNPENKLLSTAAIHLFVQHFANINKLKNGVEIEIPRVSKENYYKFYSKLSEYNVSVKNRSSFGNFVEMTLKASYADLNIGFFTYMIQNQEETAEDPANRPVLHAI